MKIIFKRSLILALTLTMVLSMCGCRSLRKKVAYKEYVENIMDVNFKGNFNKYIKDDNGNESDALSMYEDCASNLGSQLLKHYSASNVSSVTVSERFTALAKEIYKHSKFTVSEAYADGDNYYVDVEITPMNFLNQAHGDVVEYINKFNDDVENGMYSNSTTTEYEEAFAMGLADILESHAAEMKYGEPVKLKVLIDDNGKYYSISSDSIVDIENSMFVLEDGSEETDTESDTSSEADTTADTGSDEAQ